MLREMTALFGRLEQAGVLYCVMRDAAPAIRDGGELDVLVHPMDLERAAALLGAAGFIRLRAWGHAPHHFFVRYFQDSDCWVKFDVVTSVAYGRPAHCMVPRLGDDCLAARRHTGVCFIPGAEDELFTLLLHCVVDTRQFRRDHVARLLQLRREAVDEGRLRAHVACCWPGQDWPQLARLIDEQDWNGLLAQRTRVAARLSEEDRLGTIARACRDRALRRLQRWVGIALPAAPSVAVLAPDGAGKSTLVAGIQGRFFHPVQAVYMGLYSRDTRRHRDRGLPGLGMARHLILQWRRYLSARCHQAAGRLVLFDRYTYDALLPDARAAGAPRRLRRWVLSRACPAPDLVVLLDAPGEVLFARKGEHTPELLERQRQSYLAMRPRFMRSAVIDVRRDPATVRRHVTALVWDEYRRRSGTGAQRRAVRSGLQPSQT